MQRRNSSISNQRFRKKKSERKKCKSTQNILFDGCYVLFEEYLQKKNVCILKLYRGIGKTLEESLRGYKLRSSKSFEWIIKQLLNSAFIWCEESCYPPQGNNRFRYLSNSLRLSSQQIRYILLSINHWKYSLSRFRKKSFNVFLAVSGFVIGSETNMYVGLGTPKGRDSNELERSEVVK